MSGKPGRPADDRLLRQCEIYRAVGPLLLDTGARQLTMRQAAKAACLSPGGLYHYFSTKQDLVLFGVQPAAGMRLCLAFHAQHGWLKDADFDRFLSAWVDFAVDFVAFGRPAIQAAVELGQNAFWDTVDHGINAGLADLQETLDLLVSNSDKVARLHLSRSLRTSLFTAYFDRALPPQQLRDELLDALGAYCAAAQGYVAPDPDKRARAASGRAGSG